MSRIFIRNERQLANLAVRGLLITFQSTAGDAHMVMADVPAEQAVSWSNRARQQGIVIKDGRNSGLGAEIIFVGPHQIGETIWRETGVWPDGTTVSYDQTTTQVMLANDYLPGAD